MASEFLAVDDLGEKAIGRGIIGGIGGTPVTKLPMSYLPAGCYFLITYKDAIMFPKQLSEAKVHEDPPGISGALLEGRAIYDAFVIGKKSVGVYAGVDSLKKLTCSITPGSNHSFTITATNADKFAYTTDGTDPRYSSSATIGSSGSITGGGTVNAVAFVDYPHNYFTSDVATQAV
jgi:hypothetical protein